MIFHNWEIVTPLLTCQKQMEGDVYPLN